MFTKCLAEIKRVWENVKWCIFNHPCYLDDGRDNPPCNYCGSTKNTWHFRGVYCICASCKKKVYDEILNKAKQGEIK